MSQTVVVDGEMALKINIDGEVSLNSIIDGDLGVLFGTDGLEYETGTWTTTTNTITADIEFARQHVGVPFFVALVDVTNTLNTTTPSNQAYYNFNIFNLFGAEIFRNEEDYMRYSATSWTLVSANRLDAANRRSYEEPTYVTNVGFRAYNSNSSNWCVDRTYRWIAIWKA